MSEIKGKKKSPAKTVALVGIMTASVECVKLALAFLPNIEAVSLLLALYGYVFGIPGILSAFLFVCVEPVIWGVNTWVLSYFLYWPLIPTVFMILSRFKIKNRFAVSGVIVILTLWFGVLTTLVDTGLFSGFFDNFWYRFGVMYARGIVFFAVHTISNFLIFTLLFGFLAKRLRLLKDRTDL